MQASISTRLLKLRFNSRPLVFIRDNDPFQQMKQVVRACDLRWRDAKLFSRCLACNEKLLRVDREAVAGLVPATILLDLAPIDPRHVVEDGTSPYSWHLHVDHGGRWSYDLRLKPPEEFPVPAGWLRAVRRGHAQLAAGVDAVLDVERRGGVRRLAGIAELRRSGAGLTSAVEVLRFTVDGVEVVDPAAALVARLAGHRC